MNKRKQTKQKRKLEFDYTSDKSVQRPTQKIDVTIHYTFEHDMLISPLNKVFLRSSATNIIDQLCQHHESMDEGFGPIHIHLKQQ